MIWTPWYNWLYLHIHNRLLQFVIHVCLISLSMRVFWLKSYLHEIIFEWRLLSEYRTSLVLKWLEHVQSWNVQNSGHDMNTGGVCKWHLKCHPKNLKTIFWIPIQFSDYCENYLSGLQIPDPKLSGIQMNLVFSCPKFRCLLNIFFFNILTFPNHHSI